MKRIIAIALTLVMAFSLVFAFSSCGKKEEEKKQTAYEVYTAALNKNNELDSYELAIDMKMSVAADGVSTDIPMSYDIKVAGAKSGSPVYSAEMKMSMAGMTFTVPMYFDGNYLYTEMFGEKMKESAENSDLDLESFTTLASKLQSEEAFNGVTVTENEDGTKSMEIAMNSGDFNEAYGAFMDALLGSLGEELNGVGVSTTVDNAKSIVTVNKDGYIEKVAFKGDIKLTMTVEGENSEMTISLDVNSEYRNIGETVTVTAPEDLDSYKESSGGSEIF